MKDFAQKYDQGVYFHIAGGTMADDYGKRDAFKVLVLAARRSYAEEVELTEVDEALGYLKGFSTRDRPFDDFRKAFGITEPVRRVQALYDALHRIQGAVS